MKYIITTNHIGRSYIRLINKSIENIIQEVKLPKVYFLFEKEDVNKNCNDIFIINIINDFKIEKCASFDNVCDIDTFIDEHSNRHRFIQTNLVPCLNLSNKANSIYYIDTNNSNKLLYILTYNLNSIFKNVYCFVYKNILLYNKLRRRRCCLTYKADLIS